MSYRYLGQLTDPAGTRVVYLARGDKEASAKLGSTLEGGFAVVALSESRIHLLHEATQTRFELAIPADPTAVSP